jgi:HNH endonuclease
MEKILERADGCWEWTGARDGGGYGQISTGSRTDGSRRLVKAHRVTYEFFVGPIPDDLEIDHLCNRHWCVNPAHLNPVTHQQNTARWADEFSPNARKTHCIWGHPFNEENTYIRPNGNRTCRTCNAASQQGRRGMI